LPYNEVIRYIIFKKASQCRGFFVGYGATHLGLWPKSWQNESDEAFHLFLKSPKPLGIVLGYPTPLKSHLTQTISALLNETPKTLMPN